MQDNTEDDYYTSRSDAYDTPRQTYNNAPAKRAHDPPPSHERENKPAARRPSVHSNTSHGPRKKTSRAMRPNKVEPKTEEPVEDSAWIHRDKLAQIEIQEMEEAGMHVRQPNRSDSVSRAGASAPGSRSVSRAGVRRAQSRDRLDDFGPSEEALDAYTNGYDEFDRKRVSTIHAVENEDEDGHHSFDPEIRTAEEVAAEHSAFRTPSHTVRPSTSRIPISKISPVPVPNNVVERDSPLPRSRSGSGAVPTSWEELSYAKRTRSGSVGSGILLDEMGDGTSRPQSAHLTNSSPERNNLHQTPAKNKKKDEAARRNNVAPKKRSTSSQRPGSSAKNRPSTSHNRPEGEAPWIASMYKPDPRLPPDQQILPTVAKRMMQEQWEREGKLGSVYDKQFRLLNDDEIQPQNPPAQNNTSRPVVEQSKPAVPVKVDSTDKENLPPEMPAELEGAWPLESAHKSDSASIHTGANGGYRTTPPIATTPPKRSSTTNATGELSQTPATKRTSVMRAPDIHEKEETRQKGCCCVLM